MSCKCESELKAAMQALFPLAEERDLPWAACHLQNFLKARIDLEVAEKVRHFTSRVVRVLCEVSPPKQHVDDMARIAVNKAHESDMLLQRVDELKLKLVEKDDAIRQLRERVTDLGRELESARG